MQRIVLTGGPGAGKTTIAEHLAAAFPERLVMVPEAATQIYTRHAARWDRLDLAGRLRMQRLIYHHQLEQEARLSLLHPGRMLLLDRGTVDGAAYWPHGAEDYWNDLGTNHTAELARYGAVILLESAAAIGAYDGETSNRVRFEDAAGALANGRLIEQLWRDHPSVRRVRAYASLQAKIAAVEEIIGGL